MRFWLMLDVKRAQRMVRQIQCANTSLVDEERTHKFWQPVPQIMLRLA